MRFKILIKDKSLFNSKAPNAWKGQKLIFQIYIYFQIIILNFNFNENLLFKNKRINDNIKWLCLKANH